MQSSQRPAEKRRRALTKCAKCRQDRVKCKPEDRVWPAKCIRCVALGKCCSENLRAREEILASSQPESGPSIPTGSLAPDEASHQIRKRDQGSVSSHQQDHRSSKDDGRANFTLNDRLPGGTQPFRKPQLRNLTEAGSAILDDFQNALKCLNNADIKLKLYQNMRLELPLPTNLISDMQSTSRTESYLGLSKEDVREELVALVRQAAIYGRASLHSSSRRVILTRLCEIWERLIDDIPDETDYCSLLVQLEAIYEDSGEVMKREEVLEKIAQQISSRRNAEHEVHQKLAKSYQMTTTLINSESKLFVKKLHGHHLNLTTPLLPLQLAVQADVFHTFVLLIAQESDILGLQQGEDFADPVLSLESKDIFGRTVMFGAVRSHDHRFLSTLLNKGANVHARDCIGRSIIENAARQGHLHYVQDLVNAGAGLSPVPSALSCSPLQAAIEGSHLEVVQYFLQNGVNPHVWQGYDKKDVLTLAREKDAIKVLHLLEGIDVMAGTACSSGNISKDTTSSAHILTTPHFQNTQSLHFASDISTNYFSYQQREADTEMDAQNYEVFMSGITSQPGVLQSADIFQVHDNTATPQSFPSHFNFEARNNMNNLTGLQLPS